jgi:hypothetical protein
LYRGAWGGASSSGGATGTGGTGVSCDPTTGSWQHVLSCDIVAPGNIFHSCVDYFATAQSAASVLDRETAACTELGGAPLADAACAAASSLGGCIDAIDPVVSSGDAEYSQAFQYPGMNLTAEVVAEGCAEDGHPYLSASADPSTGAPAFTCP